MPPARPVESAEGGEPAPLTATAKAVPFCDDGEGESGVDGVEGALLISGGIDRALCGPLGDGEAPPSEGSADADSDGVNVGAAVDVADVICVGDVAGVAAVNEGDVLLLGSGSDGVNVAPLLRDGDAPATLKLGVDDVDGDALPATDVVSTPRCDSVADTDAETTALPLDVAVTVAVPVDVDAIEAQGDDEADVDDEAGIHEADALATPTGDACDVCRLVAEPDALTLSDGDSDGGGRDGDGDALGVLLVDAVALAQRAELEIVTADDGDDGSVADAAAVRVVLTEGDAALGDGIALSATEAPSEAGKPLGEFVTDGDDGVGDVVPLSDGDSDAETVREAGGTALDESVASGVSVRVAACDGALDAVTRRVVVDGDAAAIASLPDGDDEGVTLA